MDKPYKPYKQTWWGLLLARFTVFLVFASLIPRVATAAFPHGGVGVGIGVGFMLGWCVLYLLNVQPQIRIGRRRISLLRGKMVERDSGRDTALAGHAQLRDAYCISGEILDYMKRTSYDKDPINQISETMYDTEQKMRKHYAKGIRDVLDRDYEEIRDTRQKTIKHALRAKALERVFRARLKECQAQKDRVGAEKYQRELDRRDDIIEALMVEEGVPWFLHPYWDTRLGKWSISVKPNLEEVKTGTTFGDRIELVNAMLDDLGYVAGKASRKKLYGKMWDEFEKRGIYDVLP